MAKWGSYLITVTSCAIRSGLGQVTEVHCVGDGAAWIAKQTERVFGTAFLIDFYHLCDYLSTVSKSCAPDDCQSFYKKLKQLMKENQVSAVTELLNPFAEPASAPDEKAPVRCCIRYITNRPGQFDYKGTSEKGLPIGSGEIESAYRYYTGEIKNCGSLVESGQCTKYAFSENITGKRSLGRLSGKK